MITRPKETIYQHRERGTRYVVRGYGRLQLEGEHDDKELVIYQDVVDGSMWARPRDQFFDGRFVVSRRPVDLPEDLVPEAAIENVVNELVFQKYQGTCTLEECDEEEQAELRDNACELIASAMRGGISLGS